jgi:hypothetical protein
MKDGSVQFEILSGTGTSDGKSGGAVSGEKRGKH